MCRQKVDTPWFIYRDFTVYAVTELGPKTLVGIFFSYQLKISCQLNIIEGNFLSALRRNKKIIFFGKKLLYNER